MEFWIWGLDAEEVVDVGTEAVGDFVDVLAGGFASAVEPGGDGRLAYAEVFGEFVQGFTPPMPVLPFGESFFKPGFEIIHVSNILSLLCRRVDKLILICIMIITVCNHFYTVQNDKCL